jgi:transcriptional regulator with XRE-family HTH domain
MTEFVEWLEQQLRDRGWSHQDMADRSGTFTRSSVSMVLSGKQNPGLEFCKGVARALHMRPETVLRKAGLLPPVPGDTDDPSLNAWWEFGKQLSEAERAEAIRYATWAFFGGRPRPADREREDPAPNAGAEPAT